MDQARWDRLAAAGGIVGVLLFVVAAFLYGTPPAVDEDAASVGEFFADNRDRVLWAVFLQGPSVLALLWFAGALVAEMRRAGEDSFGSSSRACS